MAGSGRGHLTEGKQPSGPGYRARRWLPGASRLLAHPIFGPFFAGKLLSTAGVWIHNVVSAVLVFELTGSAVLVGLVSVAQFVPQLLLTPWSGSRADRGNRMRQLIAGRLLVGAGSLGVTFWSVIGGLDADRGATVIILSSLVVGIGFSVGGPAMHDLIPSMVSRADLPDAVSLNAMPFTVARALGPLVGIGVLLWLGPATTFALAGAGNLLFAVILARISIPQSGRTGGGDGSIRRAFQYLRSDKRSVALIIGVGAVGMGTDPVVTLTAPLATKLGGGEPLVGVIASAFGVGSLMAYGGLGRARRSLGTARAGWLGLIVLAIGTAFSGLAPRPVVAVIGFVLAGAGMTVGLTTLTILLQERIPDELRGRIMAVWSMSFLGSRPFAAFINGAVADLVSVNAAFLLLALLVLVSARQVAPSRLNAEACL